MQQVLCLPNEYVPLFALYTLAEPVCGCLLEMMGCFLICGLGRDSVMQSEWKVKEVRKYLEQSNGIIFHFLMPNNLFTLDVRWKSSFLNKTEQLYVHINQSNTNKILNLVLSEES